MTVFHVVSTSGGKDSTATLLLALERFGRDRVIPIFCDTGNEHEEVHSYLDYLEGTLGIKIRRLMASFDAEIAAKRQFIARDRRVGREYTRVEKTDGHGNPVYVRDRFTGEYLMQPVVIDEKTGETELRPVRVMGWDGGRKVRWSNKAKRRALAVLHPTGNPFLDLCMWKGRFPSRKTQFCTQELKTRQAIAFQAELIEAGHKVVSWQGVRRDESANRRHAKDFEAVGEGLYIYRPIAGWTAMQVFEFCASRGIRPNPLYLQGMGRVGCMPCINVGKLELREIAARFPQHIERVAEWEPMVGQASKRGSSTFFAESHASPDLRVIFNELNVWARVEWAKTTRGGRQYDLLAEDTPAASASAYGLCE